MSIAAQAVAARGGVGSAPLPVSYENAKRALATCSSLDECKDWADKAAALASYARMSEDDELERMSQRIRARATRRAGEILKTIDARGDHRKTEGDRHSSQAQAGSAAGLSEHQTKQAVRVANVPSDDFDAAVEAEKPATLTALAKAGTKSREPKSEPAREYPEHYQQATHVMGAMRRFAEKCRDHDNAKIASAVLPHEVSEARALVTEIDGWLDGFVVNLRSK